MIIIDSHTRYGRSVSVHFNHLLPAHYLKEATPIKNKINAPTEYSLEFVENPIVTNIKNPINKM